MTKQTINVNYPGDLINVGTPNKGDGDNLRSAFVKINDALDKADANFAELYATDTNTKYHLGDDVQFIDIAIDPETEEPSGGITIQSGFNTAMPVYIKGGNALQDGVGGNVIIEAGAPPLAEGYIQGGGPYAGTVGNIEMSANQTTIESLGNIWTFDADGALSFPLGEGIFNRTGIDSGLNIRSNADTGTIYLYSYGEDGDGTSAGNIYVNPTNVEIYSNWQNGDVGEMKWTFDNSGILNLPESIVAGNAFIQTPASINLQVNANGSIWTFGTDGNLTLPSGGLVSPNGYSSLSTTSSVWAVGDIYAGLDWKGTNTLYASSYGVEIYTNSNGTAHTSGDENYWKFGTDGNLSLPAGGVIKNSDGSTYGGGGGGISISDFGDGFSLTAANKVVTRKLYSTNLTQPNQHYRLELDTNGVVVLPDQSIINGSTLRGIYGTGEANYTGITIGPDAAHQEESWMYVDHTGSYIATQYNTNQKLWQFKNDGSTIFPSGAGFAKGDNGQLKTNDGTTLTLDIRDNSGRGFYTNSDGFSLRGSGSNTWKFGADGNLTIPGELRSAAGVGNVVIEANNGTARTWTFGGDGALKLPSSDLAISGDGGPTGNALIHTTVSAISILRNGVDGVEIYEHDVSFYADNTQVAQVVPAGLKINHGTLTFPDATVQSTAFRDVASNVFFVDPSRSGGTYTRTGTFTSPYNTITAATSAAVTAGYQDSSPATIILMGNITENVTLKPGIFLTSLGTGTHGSPNITGTVTITSSTGTTVTNHYSISNLRIVAPSNGHGILFTGTGPQKLFVRDMWIDASGTGDCIYMDNTGTGSTLQLDIAHMAHAGTGDVYCINVTKGSCYVTDIETAGACQVAAVQTGCTLTIDSSELDANGDVVCETYGTGVLTITNSLITNAKNNANGIQINDAGGVVTLGNNVISLTGTGGFAVQSPAGGVVYHANNVFTGNNKRSSALGAGFIALPNTWTSA